MPRGIWSDKCPKHVPVQDKELSMIELTKTSFKVPSAAVFYLPVLLYQGEWLYLVANGIKSTGFPSPFGPITITTTSTKSIWYSTSYATQTTP
jgi:hypothetical protein